VSGARVQRRIFWNNMEKVTWVWSKLNGGMVKVKWRYGESCTKCAVRQMVLPWWHKADRSAIHSTYTSGKKWAQNYNSTWHTHTHTHIYYVYMEVRLNLCSVDSSQMVTLLNPGGHSQVAVHSYTYITECYYNYWGLLLHFIAGHTIYMLMSTSFFLQAATHPTIL
jgi:hypothetical protein